MSRRAQLRTELLSLPAEERAGLAHDLLRSLDDDEADDPAEVETAWAAEIERRLAEVRAGKVELVDASVVHAAARARLAARTR